MYLIINIIVGLFVGIIINYFSDVLPLSQGLTIPVCSECDQPFTIKDYLFSFNCSKCGKPKSNRWIIVIFSSVVICVLLKFFPPNLLNFWSSLPILIIFGILSVIDIEHHAVLVVTSVVGFVLFLVYGIFLVGLLRTLLGILGGLGATLILYILGMAMARLVGKIRGQEIEEVAFGFGDVLIGTALGALTGWPSIFGVIVIGLVTFAAFSVIYFVILLISKKYQAFSTALPFAPFLILGAVFIFYL
jgi:prepilin signal peptidase PulO-like enzyme (type II secretory pathway)